MSRLKNLSKYFFDDEILYIANNGDVYLKQGVKRKNYIIADMDTNSTEHINFHALYHQKWTDKMKSFKDIDDTGSERDNWEN